MGKRSKMKRRQYKFGHGEFIETICKRQCHLCKAGNPELCYDEMYSLDSKRFMETVHKTVLEANKFLTSENYKNINECSDDEIQYIFQSFICESNFCNKHLTDYSTCSDMIGCLAKFRKQIRGTEEDNTENKVIFLTARIKKKQDKKKGKTINVVVKPKVEPTPTFFCNEKFGKEIRRILDGDNTGEQNTGEASTSGIEAIVGGQAANTEPEVPRSTSIWEKPMGYESIHN